MILRLAAALFLFSVGGATADTLRLAHHYRAAGEGPDGSKYSADVTIDVTTDTTFSIHWDIGGSHYDGFGMRRGDILAAAFYNDKSSGVIMYQVQGDGLDGSWTFKDESGVGTEHLVPVD